jgi:hypothetical protein
MAFPAALSHPFPDGNPLMLSLRHVATCDHLAQPQAVFYENANRNRYAPLSVLEVVKAG